MNVIVQQRIIIWALVAVIAVLLAVISVLSDRLNERDLDGKIARGRRTVARMLRKYSRKTKGGGEQ